MQHPYLWLMAVGLVAAVSLEGPTAFAQTCRDGQVRTEDGYCCWPGQDFDVAQDRCVGAPVCPTGYVGSGSDCVLRAMDPANDHAPRTIPERESDGGLIGGGVAFIGVGYLGAAITAIILGQQEGRDTLGVRRPVMPNWWAGFFPLVHATAAIGACCGSYDAMMVVGGIIGGVFEVVGTILVVLGAIGHERTSATASVGPFELEVGFGAAGTDAGAHVAARW